ncbi:hypothetical protein Q4S45_08740 [Massilia sp. R2A-15]|uniref:hypothetical protein n=1 Tax=Massilia sp. R2A-15 TaxID=3064278 RepID=UPI0027334854|nr:hypothetical protein [Massilia sp. R2A-15]WLI91187.1 hypothetical protein Q4S45_08740 [Massilia sp. R2A-15]
MMRVAFLLSLLVPLLFGCSTAYKTPVFAAKDGGSTSFPGAAELLDAEHRLNVILVHGMCTHDEKWAQDTATAFLRGMGQSDTQAGLAPVPVPGSAIQLFQRTVPIGQRGEINLSAIVWSPATAPLKQQLCYDQSERTQGACAEPRYPYQRYRINRLIKDRLLDDCLADAVIYLGKSRGTINGQMQAVIAKALNVAPDANNLFIADSLGSKMVFDAIFKMAMNRTTAQEGQRIFNNTAQIFMRANQIPILALADTPSQQARMFSCESDGYPADPIGDLVRRQGCPGAERARVRAPLVVAFSDPSDVLSYTLAGSPHARSQPYPVIDVIVSNAPGYLGWLERPDHAHLHYDENPEVNRLIGCGNRSPAYCRQPAR